MITLTREKGNRMWGGGSGSGAVGGGGSEVNLAGYSTEAWVDENYVGKTFFEQLFTIHGTITTTIKNAGGTVISGPTTVETTLSPNTLPGTEETTDSSTGYTTTVVTAITSIEANYGLWTDYFLSALGLNSAGGGGASTLEDLIDVSINNPTNGQSLVYNATSGKWENQTVGGGGSGTLTSIGLVMPTGFSVSPATLTQDGSFNVGFATGYSLPLTADVEKGVAAYGWGNHAQAGYVKIRDNGWSYNCVANNHSSNVTVKYWRVTLPIDTARWTMIHMEFSLLEKYTNGNSGKIIVAGHFGPNLDWTYFCASTLGNLSSNIKVYASDKKYIYIYTNAPREVLMLDKILCEDGIINQNLSGVTIDYVDSLPETHQTATMLYGLHSGNVGFGTEGADYIPITLAGTTKNVLTQHQSLSAYLTSNDAADTYLSKTDAANTYLSIAFFSRLFQAKNGSTNVNPNDTTSTIDNIKAMFGFWTDQYLSALGQGDAGTSGGSLATLDDVALSNPTNGQVLKYNSESGKWVNANESGGGGGSTAWADITGKPTTISGYGITDAYISNGTIVLGSNSITPLTSFTENDPTVPAWAKAATKPSYTFSELTSHPTTLSGYGITDAYTKTEADTKFMTIAAFENLFNAIGSDGSTKISHPYASGVASIKALVGVWTEQFVSALGLNSAGTGGGSIATLDDVVLTNPQNGQVLKYSNGRWVNANESGGGATSLSGLSDVDPNLSPTNGQALVYNGTSHQWEAKTIGGGSGTLTSIGLVMPTGFSVSPATLTQNGSFNVSFASGYSLPTTAKQTNWDTAYTFAAASGFGNAGTDYVPITLGSTTKNVLTDHQSLSSYATMQWVSQQGYLTSQSNLNASKLTSGTVDFARLPTMYWANVAISDQSSTSTEPQFANVRLRDGSANYGSYLRFGDGSYVYICEDNDDHMKIYADQGMDISAGTGGGKIEGFHQIELNPNGTLSGYGGYIDFHFNGSRADYTSRLIEDASGVLSINAMTRVSNVDTAVAAGLKVGAGQNGSYIQIGDIRIVYDNAATNGNNALKIIKADGTAANLYATGGVSALGFQGNDNDGSIGTLTVTDELIIGNDKRISCEENMYIGSPTSEGWVFMADMCSQEHDSNDNPYWLIRAAGQAEFDQVRAKKFYLDSSRYIFLNSSNVLCYYNGSTTKTIQLS